jgi:hypothetical protein
MKCDCLRLWSPAAVNRPTLPFSILHEAGQVTGPVITLMFLIHAIVHVNKELAGKEFVVIY